jgi:hypothetical protein
VKVPDSKTIWRLRALTPKHVVDLPTLLEICERLSKVRARACLLSIAGEARFQSDGRFSVFARSVS